MKKSYIIAVIISVVAFIWVMSGVLTPSQDSGAADTAQTPHADGGGAHDDALAEVRIREIVATSYAHDIMVTGRSHASRQVALKAEIAGQVRAIIAEKGAEVKEGDVLASLDERERKARAAEAAERLAQRTIEHNAAKKLEDKGFNSKVRLAQAAADMEQSRADLKVAQIELDNVAIKAPFDGIVFEQMVELGDYVRVGDTLFHIVDLDPIEIRGFVTEQQVSHITLGSTAMTRFIDGKTAEGIVTYIAPAVDTETRTFEIEISLPNSDGSIIDGMTVQIAIPTDPQKAHKISPSVLALDDKGVVGVKIVAEDNKVQFMPVSIIADKSGHMLVGGLPDKVRLITVGQDFVIDGQHVKPVKANGDGLL